MKSFFIGVFAVLELACWANWSSETFAADPTAQPIAKPVLVIAAYDSFLTKSGMGPAIFPLFEKKCGCTIKVIATGDGTQLLSRLQIDAERGKPQIQIAVGLDQVLWERAKPYLEKWGDWKPKAYDRVSRKLGAGFLPFDYGVFAFISDREALKSAHLEVPRKLADLLVPEWKRNVILEDPRTSLPGQAFVLYADAVGGDGFWPKFRSQWLTLAPGWDAAYGLFLKKEAPLVWSYTTSQAYHEAHGDNGSSGKGQRRYQALMFEDGNPVQLEGAALVKGSFANEGHRKVARDFLEFLLSPEVQALIPEKNWMLPVMPDTPLPKAFKNLPAPVRVISTPTDPRAVEQILDRWKRAIRGPTR